jgi:DNA-binding transcriptional ArsR family regulator
MNPSTLLQVNEQLLRKGRTVFRSVNHALRQQIITLIHENERMTVTAIYHTLGIEQSVASQHLAILREAKLVNTQREGHNIFYSVNYERMNRIHVLSEQLINSI